jgi:hypothetical protein
MCDGAGAFPDAAAVSARIRELREGIARAERELRALERELAGLLALAGRRPGDGSDQPGLFQREAQGNLF